MISSHQREGGAEVDTPPYKINEMAWVGGGFDGRRTDAESRKRNPEKRAKSAAAAAERAC